MEFSCARAVEQYCTPLRWLRRWRWRLGHTVRTHQLRGRRRGNVLGAEKLPAGVEIPREQRQPDMRAGVASVDEGITHDKLLSPVGQELDLRPYCAAAVA